MTAVVGAGEPDLLCRLAVLDSCAVSDALDFHGMAGAVCGLEALAAGRRIVGSAVTVQLGQDDGRKAARHLCTAAIERSGPGKIIVVAHNGCTVVSGWGGLLSLAAVKKGVEGVIIDGACRDVDESREFGFTVYGRAAVAVSARGRIVETDWNVSVVIAGVSVSPADLVLADASGVVVIPRAQASTVIERAEKIAARERSMMARIRNGEAISGVMGADYESMNERGRLP